METLEASADVGTGRPSPVTASELLAQIDRSKSGGASLTFSRRNMIETILLHFGLLAFTVLSIVLWKQATDSVLEPWLFGSVGVQAAVAVVATFLAVRSYRLKHTYESTDRWDGVTGSLQVGAIALGTVWTGGITSPLWLVVVVGTMYLATVLVYTGGLIFIVALAAGPTLSGWLSDSLDAQQTPLAVPMLVGLTIALPAAFLIVRGVSKDLYDAAEGSGWDQVVVKSQVRELVDNLSHVSEGDLTVQPDSILTADEREGHQETSEYLQALAGVFAHTVESLRVLVGSVRVGGEQIGSAASQVLVAAREQAASASEQSSAVAETTATIEELAATAAQIAETSEQVAVFATETLGFAEQGRVAVAASVAGDGFDCCSGWIRLRLGRWGWGRRVRRLVGFCW